MPYGHARRNRVKQICEFSFYFKTLLPELFFSSFFGIYPKIGSFRLPTHSRDAHRKFFWWSLLKLKSKVLLNDAMWARWRKRLRKNLLMKLISYHTLHFSILLSQTKTFLRAYNSKTYDVRIKQMIKGKVCIDGTIVILIISW